MAKAKAAAAEGAPTTVREILSGTFLADALGINKDRFLAELTALAEKSGLGADSPVTAVFVKQAEALYGAFLTPEAINSLKVTGAAELLALWQTGRVPVRKQRVGASTA